MRIVRSYEASSSGEFSGCVSYAVFHVETGFFVNGEYPVFCPCLDGHVADAESVVHRKGLHAVSAKLHALVKGAIDPYRADDMQDDVFAADPRLQLSRQLDANGGGNTKPRFARGNACCTVGRPHACGECSPTLHTCMYGYRLR